VTTTQVFEHLCNAIQLDKYKQTGIYPMFRHGTPYFPAADGKTAQRYRLKAFDTALTRSYRERNIQQGITEDTGHACDSSGCGINHPGNGYRHPDGMG